MSKKHGVLGKLATECAMQVGEAIANQALEGGFSDRERMVQILEDDKAKALGLTTEGFKRALGWKIVRVLIDQCGGAPGLIDDTLTTMEGLLTGCDEKAMSTVKRE